jgi:hypothetical protein
MGEATIDYNFTTSPISPCTLMILLGQILLFRLMKNLGFRKKCKFIFFSFWKNSPIIYIKHLRFEFFFVEQ